MLEMCVKKKDLVLKEKKLLTKSMLYVLPWPQHPEKSNCCKRDCLIGQVKDLSLCTTLEQGVSLRKKGTEKR